MKERLRIVTNGLLKENPSLRLVLGTCPTLAVTTLAVNGLGMGLAATFVLVCSNIAISALRKIIPDKVRLPAYITVIATFVTVLQMLVKALCLRWIRRWASSCRSSPQTAPSSASCC